MDARLQADYNKLYNLFNEMNDEFFGGVLPEIGITVSTGTKNTCGYYHPKQFKATDDLSLTIDRLDMSADYFKRPTIDTCATLLHEMVHMHQNVLGTACRAGYHDKKFAQDMETVGLICSTTGKPGGKKTGQSMDHYIEESGHFDRWFRKTQTGLTFGVIGKPSLLDGLEDEDAEKEKKPKSKVKYTCPTCQAKAWAKPKSKLICGEDYGIMEAETEDEEETDEH